MNPAAPGGPVAAAMRAAARLVDAATADAEALQTAFGPTHGLEYPASAAYDAACGVLWSQATAAARAMIELVLLAAGDRLGTDAPRPAAAVELDGRLWIARPETDDAPSGPGDGPMRLTVVPIGRFVRL